MISLRAPVLLRAILAGVHDRHHTTSVTPLADATPPPPNLRVEHPPRLRRPPWIPHTDARAILGQLLDDVADAIAPPPGLRIARHLDTPGGGETPEVVEDDDE